MEKLPSYYRLIKSYEGKGNIQVSDGRALACDFECGQNEDGEIIVGINIDPIHFAIFMRDLHTISRVSGYTSVGQFLEADIALWTQSKMSSSSEGSSTFAVAYANTLKVGNDDLKVPLNAIRAYLVNFEFILPFTWHFGSYDLAIRRVKEYDTSLDEMRATKRPKKTAELTITWPNNHVADISEVEQILHDTCLLLSLAKSCRIQWLYWDACSADEKLVRSYHWDGWSSPFGDWPIVYKHPPEAIRIYLSQTLEPYREVQNEGIWQFDGAITHFVDTLSSESMLELKATNLVVLTDYLTQLFAKHKKVTYFVERDSFADKKQSLQKAVRELLGSIFSERDLVENQFTPKKNRSDKQRTTQEMADKLDCLNSRSFKSLLRSLQKDHLKLEVDEEELDLYVKIRNKLVHEASFLKETDFVEMEIPYENPPRQFCRILSLTSRIMLAILKYHGDYHDWRRFKTGEWAGSNVSGLVKMPYLQE